MGSINPTEQKNMFITYDGLIKNFQLTMLEILKTDVMQERYKDVLNMDSIKNADKSKLESLCVHSGYENILYTLATKNDPQYYDELLRTLFLEFDDLFMESEELPLAKSIRILLKQSFTNNIYMYTPSYDVRVHHDLKNMYNLSNVIYVYGDIDDVLKNINEKIHCFAINDVSYIYDIINANKLSYTELIIGNYGYNYTTDDKGVSTLKIPDFLELNKKHVFKYVLHNPFPGCALE